MLSGLLTGYQAQGETETADVGRMMRLARTAGDPWARSTPLHFTASALVLHPPSRRVLLRWHVKHGLWLQVGGHADPGETDAFQIALREAREETGLTDLAPWPDARILHVVVCYVRASATEPEHEHADLRYLLATADPDAIRPENPDSPLRWLDFPQARVLVGANNLRHTLDRAEGLLSASPGRMLTPIITQKCTHPSASSGGFRWIGRRAPGRNVPEIFQRHGTSAGKLSSFP